MSNRFTERAQRVILGAQEEAQRLRHNYVGAEHILLAIAKLGEGVGVQILANLGVELEKIRAEVERAVGTGQSKNLLGEIPFNADAKKVLEVSVEESQKFGHSHASRAGVPIFLTSSAFITKSRRYGSPKRLPRGSEPYRFSESTMTLQLLS